MTPEGTDRRLRATGVGLRGRHVPQILSEQPAVPWFELLTDNHLADGGPLRFQAEAIADLIDSSSEQAVRSAQRSLHGDFSKAIDDLRQQIIELRVYVEAALDFPEEEIDFLADEAITKRLESIKQQFDEIFKRARQGSLLREGMHLVIAGRPNAGKSSLMNALAGTETAIVTEIAGTTRDVLRESINLDGMPLHVIDTAGLRHSDDPVEQIGIERAWKAIKNADLLILLVDDFFDQYPQLVGIKGFEHIIVGTVFHGFNGGGNGTVGDDHDDGDIRIIFLQVTQNIQPADALHFNIYQQDIKSCFFQLLQRILSAGSCLNGMPVPFEPAGQRLAHDQFIINDQDLGAAHLILLQGY